MRITVIVPCRNEERFIGQCLDSILAAEFPHDQLEVLVVDGNSDDRTAEIVGGYTRRFPFIRRLENPERIVPTALNRGVRAATGEVILRMDAHATFPPDYIPRLLEALESSGADNVGGRIETVPAAPGPVACAIALAISHPFGVGNSWFRIGSARPRWVDTVPFGCYRRDVFQRIGLFDEELVRNQDDEFNHRLIREGGRILLVPAVVSTYYARDSFRNLARMFYQYGRFKPLASLKLGRIMTVRQLIPSAFVLAGFGLAVVGVFWPVAATLWLTVMLAYGFMAVLFALPAARAHGIRCALALSVAFPVVHASYGIGFLRGLLDLLRARGKPRAAATVPLSR
jgi:glycosyltransferase involved in cell wall biosynthesis